MTVARKIPKTVTTMIEEFHRLRSKHELAVSHSVMDT